MEGKQTYFPIEEVFHLFEVHSKKELNAKIDERIEIINNAGKEGITYYGYKAKEYCLGVRKIQSICNTENNLDMDKYPPSDDSQVDYNYMTVKFLKEARLLAEGKVVYVNYIDDDSLDTSIWAYEKESF